jgi:DnaK suppressor protein
MPSSLTAINAHACRQCEYLAQENAMSTTLTREQLTMLKASLAQRQQALRAGLQSQLGGQGRVEHAREQLLQGLDDEREHDADREVDLARSDSTVGALAQIEAALQRLDGPEYGLCSDCGEAIGWERLQHSPEVTRCIACQTILEKSSGADTHRSI